MVLETFEETVTPRCTRIQEQESVRGFLSVHEKHTRLHVGSKIWKVRDRSCSKDLPDSIEVSRRREERLDFFTYDHVGRAVRGIRAQSARISNLSLSLGNMRLLLTSQERHLYHSFMSVENDSNSNSQTHTVILRNTNA